MFLYYFTLIVPKKKSPNWRLQFPVDPDNENRPRIDVLVCQQPKSSSAVCKFAYRPRDAKIRMTMIHIVPRRLNSALRSYVPHPGEFDHPESECPYDPIHLGSIPNPGIRALLSERVSTEQMSCVEHPPTSPLGCSDSA